MTDYINNNNLQYIAIDESNHGKVPEVYVAVISNSIRDIERKEHVNKTNRDLGKIWSLMQTKKFKHLVIDQKLKNAVGGGLLRVVAYSALISNFEDIDKVIIDGSCGYNDGQKLKSIFPNKPRIEFYPKGDKHYPLINDADKIAYFLARVYLSMSNTDRKNAFCETRIELNDKNFEEYLERKENISVLPSSARFHDESLPKLERIIAQLNPSLS